MTVRNLFQRRKSRRVRLLVNSGAAYSVLPLDVWRALGLKPVRTIELDLADGKVIERGLGQAEFSFHGVSAISPVVLGGPRDAALLGAVTLETLGLVLNPLTRELQPMRMLLARIRRTAARASQAPCSAHPPREAIREGSAPDAASRAI